MPTTDFFKANLGRLFNTRKIEKILWLLATLALILLVARQSAELTWQLSAPLLNIGRPATGPFSPAPAANRPQPLRSQSDLAEEIALFGQAASIPPATNTSASDSAPATSLNLVLKGIVAVRPMRRALAIIAEQGGAAELLYGQGENLPGNALIREIHADRVIISRDGIRETLFLDALQKQANNRNTLTPASRATPATNTIRSRGDGTNWQINRDYWQERVADIPGLAREIGVEVYKENNQQKGYRLVAVQGSKLLTELGLQAGDILLSVNGVAMNSAQEGLSAYQRIKNGGQVTVEINRNGRHETRSYNVGD